MKGSTIDGRLALVGYRPDGVIAVDIGDSLIVLCNVNEGIKTKPIDRLSLDKCGPWMDFEVPPADTVRERLSQIINASSARARIVAVSAVGATGDGDVERLDLCETGGYTRKDFAQMLQTADLDATGEMGTEQSFKPDADFMAHCTATIVPAMASAGMNVGDPTAFCSLLHLQRTGVMPSSAVRAAATVSHVHEALNSHPGGAAAPQQASPAVGKKDAKDAHAEPDADDAKNAPPSASDADADDEKKKKNAPMAATAPAASAPPNPVMPQQHVIPASQHEPPKPKSQTEPGLKNVAIQAPPSPKPTAPVITPTAVSVPAGSTVAPEQQIATPAPTVQPPAAPAVPEKPTIGKPYKQPRDLATSMGKTGAPPVPAA